MQKIKNTKIQEIFVGNGTGLAKEKIPSSNELIREIYEKHKDEDNFLYFSVTGESTYGFSQLSHTKSS